ncbi:retinitis pigmentosa GTPase regulator-like protein, putative [Trichomonas vaginalis G3]|uniref:Retinitis pigmentosa GTPase regulator-like protein, putative n=1 Tax=Trichomonas vaginalis (strain ATCC PRA-98 / G3) TaxID=412133 RepID=A2FW49_TRIV3|nr:L domain-like family [Trichomonas vaginalis G3]EAX90870.1 retinitis pigmentosa GTPase regulator-like protein, putative [Trichomonas vaginalis G3]KAI5547746.1 L domain-like family [Trichomonas vaginalis G3]|eukprot:XP_001303800.1 retinitis pigmentosa GTPase regulator-like protein [Trichomonas vaginalis G3]
MSDVEESIIENTPEEEDANIAEEEPKPEEEQEEENNEHVTIETQDEDNENKENQQNQEEDNNESKQEIKQKPDFMLTQKRFDYENVKRRKQELAQENTSKETKQRGRSTAQRTDVIFTNKNIQNLEKIKFNPKCTMIDLSSNKIVNFDGMPHLKCLTSMQFDSNPIRSFKGAVIQERLKWVSMKLCPISRNPYFKLMVLVAFDNIVKLENQNGTVTYKGSITTINDSKINDKLREQAYKIADHLRPELVEGKIITNLTPLRMINNEADESLPEGRKVDPSPQLLETTTRMVTKMESQVKKVKTEHEMSNSQNKPRLQSVAVKCNLLLNENTDLKSFVKKDVLNNVVDRINKLRLEFEPTENDEEEELYEEEEEEVPKLEDQSAEEPKKEEEIHEEPKKEEKEDGKQPDAEEQQNQNAEEEISEIQLKNVETKQDEEENVQEQVKKEELKQQEEEEEEKHEIHEEIHNAEEEEKHKEEEEKGEMKNEEEEEKGENEEQKHEEEEEKKNENEDEEVKKDKNEEEKHEEEEEKKNDEEEKENSEQNQSEKPKVNEDKSKVEEEEECFAEEETTNDQDIKEEKVNIEEPMNETEQNIKEEEEEKHEENLFEENAEIHEEEYEEEEEDDISNSIVLKKAKKINEEEESLEKVLAQGAELDLSVDEE